jgi:hypothetical protein
VLVDICIAKNAIKPTNIMTNAIILFASGLFIVVAFITSPKNEYNKP